MKKILIIAFLTLAGNAQAQLYIQSGAELRITGNGLVCLSNVDLQNNGAINQAAGTGKYVFNGTGNNSISGSSVSNFDVLETAKTGTATTSLSQNADVNGSVLFTSGLIDLNGKIITLDPAAFLSSENENSRIIGPSGGYVTITQNLNAPSAVNPGNIGAALTTSANLGSTVIKRSHVPATGAIPSIKRIFDISPTNNSSLNATLRLYYFDAELNGQHEGSLLLWKAPPSGTWTNMGARTVDMANNWAEQQNLADFSKWTLAAFNSALPITLTAFGAFPQQCDVVLKWTSGTEANASSYELQRSTDGTNYATIYTMPVTGSGNSYAYTDHSANKAINFYRLKMIDRDGSFTFSYIATAKTDCDARLITLWPNPASSITTLGGVQAGERIMVYGANGQLITQQTGDGNNVKLKVSDWAKGIYTVSIISKENQIVKVLKLVHQ